MSELIDNKAHRIQTLKHIIKHLHAGQAPEQVKRQLTEIVRQTDYSEIVAMEQELLAESGRYLQTRKPSPPQGDLRRALGHCGNARVK